MNNYLKHSGLTKRRKKYDLKRHQCNVCKKSFKCIMLLDYHKLDQRQPSTKRSWTRCSGKDESEFINQNRLRKYLNLGEYVHRFYLIWVYTFIVLSVGTWVKHFLCKVLNHICWFHFSKTLFLPGCKNVQLISYFSFAKVRLSTLLSVCVASWPLKRTCSFLVLHLLRT